jgi:hypothetical protein
MDSLYGGNGNDGLFGGIGDSPSDADYVDGGAGADRVYQAVQYASLLSTDFVNDKIVPDASDIVIRLSNEPQAVEQDGEMPFETYLPAVYSANGTVTGPFMGTSLPAGTWQESEIERLDAALKPIEDASPGLLRYLSRPEAQYGPAASLPVLTFYRLGNDAGGVVSADVTIERQFSYVVERHMFVKDTLGYAWGVYATGIGLGNAAFQGDPNTLNDAVSRMVAHVAYQREVQPGITDRLTGLAPGWFAAAGWSYVPAQRRAVATTGVVGLEPQAKSSPEADWMSTWVMYFRNKRGVLSAADAKVMASRFAYLDKVLPTL